MRYEQLNEYIEHYLINDKTQSAIMLNGAWGSGKSHYLKNNLIPYLKSKGRECVVVSLYGITDLKDISRAIYIELRTIKLFKSNETIESAKTIGKTIIKTVSQIVPFPNIITEVNEADMQKLYTSVDLTGKLVIFEDIERSNIDINEFLGYVNNFVEQDGVKILLVSNEDEFFRNEISKDYGENEGNKQSEIITYSEKAKKYLTSKEKCVSDTIRFYPDFSNAPSKIVKTFENGLLEKIFNILETHDIEMFFTVRGTKNLRAFKFACQKTSDIFDKIT